MLKTKGLRATLLLLSTLTVMSGAVIAPALPSLAKAYTDVPNADFLARLVLTMPALFIAASSPLAGWLLDRYGKIRILLVSMLIYAIAGTAGFYLLDIYQILVSRAILGLGVAVIMTAATALVGDYFEGPDRNRFLGLQNSMMALSGTIYIALSGLLADWSWRYSFLIYGLALPFAWLVYRFLPEPTKNQRPPTSSAPLQLGKLVGIIVLIYSLTFLGQMMFYMVPVQSPFLLESMGVYQPSLQSVGLMAVTLFAAAMALSYGRLKAVLEFSYLYALAFLLMGGGYWLVSVADSYWGVVGGMVVGGLGAGLIMPNAATWLMYVSPAHLRGRIVGGMTSVVFTGQFLSPIALQPLVNASSISGAFYYTGLVMIGIGALFLVPWPGLRTR